MKIKRLMCILSYMQDMFQQTMRELFVNEFSCEGTLLHFFVLDGSENFKYINKEMEVKEFKADRDEIDDEAVKRVLDEIYPGKMYVSNRSEIFSVESRETEVYWVFFSENLDKNTGRLLLRCVFEELAWHFNECLAFLSGVDKDSEIKKYTSEWSDRSYNLVQDILHEAEVKAGGYLERLFAPLNFQLITGLSGEYYEKSDCQSGMIFLFQNAVKELKETKFLYRFHDIEFEGEKPDEIEFIPSNIRLIRKLLQMTQKDLYLVLGEDEDKKVFKVLGIARKSVFGGEEYKFPKVIVKCKRHMQWELLANNTYIFTYKNGKFKIEQELREEYLERKLCDYFGGERKKYKELIGNLISSTKQEHGTMLVVMEEEDAREEAKRLGCMRYGFPESDPKSFGEGINQLNSIDGSVFLDISGRIHGIGMILDGASSEKGNPARGARYNSALKYRDSLKKRKIRALILIVSEDASVDFLYS